MQAVRAHQALVGLVVQQGQVRLVQRVQAGLRARQDLRDLLEVQGLQVQLGHRDLADRVDPLVQVALRAPVGPVVRLDRLVLRVLAAPLVLAVLLVQQEVRGLLGRVAQVGLQDLADRLGRQVREVLREQVQRDLVARLDLRGQQELQARQEQERVM